MMTFVAANDLLTMFVALEVLSLPAVPHVRAGPAPSAAARRRRRSSTSCSGASPRVLPLRPRAALRLRGLGQAGRHRRRRIGLAALGRAACSAGSRLLGGRAAVQGPRSARSTLDARRLPGRAHARSPRSWRPARRCGVRRDLRVLQVAFGDTRGSGAGCCGPSRSPRWRSAR
jgi:hypothetical protein